MIKAIFLLRLRSNLQAAYAILLLSKLRSFCFFTFSRKACNPHCAIWYGSWWLLGEYTGGFDLSNFRSGLGGAGGQPTYHFGCTVRSCRAVSVGHAAAQGMGCTEHSQARKQVVDRERCCKSVWSETKFFARWEAAVFRLLPNGCGALVFIGVLSDFAFLAPLVHRTDGHWWPSPPLCTALRPLPHLHTVGHSPKWPFSNKNAIFALKVLFWARKQC